MDVDFIVHSDRSLLAFQGPKAMEVLQRVTEFDLSKLYFGMFTSMKVNGGDVWVTRTGYTGEDGFEISVPNADAVALAEKLESYDEVRFAALGPRDSLRLEAGLCLYGNDLTEDITPPEAGLTWTIGKARRELCDFTGGDIIKKQLEDPKSIPRRRIGLTFTGKGAPRWPTLAYLGQRRHQIGEVTSGKLLGVTEKTSPWAMSTRRLPKPARRWWSRREASAHPPSRRRCSSSTHLLPTRVSDMTRT